jgi:hypothetical protein
MDTADGVDTVDGDGVPPKEAGTGEKQVPCRRDDSNVFNAKRMSKKWGVKKMEADREWADPEVTH